MKILVGDFFGDLEQLFDKLNGKELSYNNLLDIDAALNLMEAHEETDPTFAILKHNNACGLATRNTISDAYAAALAGDPSGPLAAAAGTAQRVLSAPRHPFRPPGPRRQRACDRGGEAP